MDTIENKPEEMLENTEPADHTGGEKKKATKPLLSKTENGEKPKKAIKAVASAGEKRPERKKTAPAKEDKEKKDAPVKKVKKKTETAPEAKTSGKADNPVPAVKKASDKDGYNRVLTDTAFSNEERYEMDVSVGNALKAAMYAMEKKQICMGITAGTEEYSLVIDNIEYMRLGITVLMENYPVKVVIPLELFYAKNRLDPTTVDESTKEGRMDFIERQRKLGKKVIGQNIRFFITEVCGKSEDGFVICKGDRKSALEVERRNYFEKKGHVYKEGEIRQAQVISVSAKGVWICIGGYETKINQFTLTNRPVEDCRTYVKAGDMLPCKIIKIDQTASGELHVGLDFIQAEISRSLPRSRMLMSAFQSRGSGAETHVNATVTKMVPRKDGGNDFYAWIKVWDCPGKIAGATFTKDGQPLTVGSLVSALVLGQTEMGYINLLAERLDGASKAMWSPTIAVNPFNVQV